MNITNKKENGIFFPFSTETTSALEDLIEFLKCGNKMIKKDKNGSGIHIKKKNRGKFTSYCGGSVTDSCIAKAKASGNPTLVKRAVFALNARKWKHQNGGYIHTPDLTSNANFMQRLRLLPWQLQTIKDWQNPNNHATHKMASTDNIAFPMVLKNPVTGQLEDFTNPKYGKTEDERFRKGYQSAVERGDTVQFKNNKDAAIFGEYYKDKYMPQAGMEYRVNVNGILNPFKTVLHKKGGKITNYKIRF